MKIEIGKGLDGIYFGMSMQDVKTKLGEPDEVYDYDYEGSISTGFEYFSREAEYEFDADEGNKLYSITVSNPSVQLFGKPIIGESIEKIREILNQNGIDDLEEDDEEHDHDHSENEDEVEGVTAFSDQLNAIFQFEENELIFFGFSPLFKDDVIDWPKY
ncbi:hypothetical protein AB3N59_05285 [Leptospira sp. WS92.C1]